VKRRDQGRNRNEGQKFPSAHDDEQDIRNAAEPSNDLTPRRGG